MSACQKRKKATDLRRRKGMKSLTAAIQTARLATVVMASDTVPALCRGDLAMSSRKKLCLEKR